MDAAIELRVLDGRQAGAGAALHRGRTLVVGAAGDSGPQRPDVVLQDAALAGSRVALTIEGQGLQLEMLAGRARIGGRELGAGERAALAWYEPFTLGTTTLAAGELMSPHWLGALARVGSAPTPDGVAPAEGTAGADEAARNAADDRTRPAEHGPGAAAARPHRYARLLGGAGAMIAVTALGVLALVSIALPAARAPSATERIAGALRAAGLETALRVETGAAGLVVTGHVASAAQRQQLERLLADAGVQPRVEVWAGDQIAQAVSDFYRIRGVPAEVTTTGVGSVRVATHASSASALAAIESDARREIAGLRAIESVNEPAPAADAPSPVVDDPGKRVAALVPGDPAYLMTADGARYFVGATLPTGHHVVAIEAQSVLLERNGALSTLAF